MSPATQRTYVLKLVLFIRFWFRVDPESAVFTERARAILSSAESWKKQQADLTSLMVKDPCVLLKDLKFLNKKYGAEEFEPVEEDAEHFEEEEEDEDSEEDADEDEEEEQEELERGEDAAAQGAVQGDGQGERARKKFPYILFVEQSKRHDSGKKKGQLKSDGFFKQALAAQTYLFSHYEKQAMSPELLQSSSWYRTGVKKERGAEKRRGGGKMTTGKDHMPFGFYCMLSMYLLKLPNPFLHAFSVPLWNVMCRNQVSLI